MQMRDDWYTWADLFCIMYMHGCGCEQFITEPMTVSDQNTTHFRCLSAMLTPSVVAFTAGRVIYAAEETWSLTSEDHLT